MTKGIAYHRRPRIIDGEALAAGLFPGISKYTFDVIYLEEQEAKARGERLQITRRKLMKLTNIRSGRTLTSHLRHFARLDVLVITRSDPGDGRGNYYETRCDRFTEAIARTRNSGRIKLGG